MENSKLTHGLIVENFKQSLVNLIAQDSLDIQSKALVLDYINIQIQNLSKQQTQKELDEYNAEQKRLEKETQEKINRNNDEEVSE